VVNVNSSESATDCDTISVLTLRKATSIDMRDSMQISSRSSASGNARLIESWRFEMAFFQELSSAPAARDRPRRCTCRSSPASTSACARSRKHTVSTQRKHDGRDQPEEQECDVGRLPAIAGHGELLACGLLRQPLPRLKSSTTLETSCFGDCRSDTFSDLERRSRLPLPGSARVRFATAFMRFASPSPANSGMISV